MTQIEIVGSMNPLFSLSVFLIPFRSPRYLSFPSICEYPCLPDSSSSCPTDRSLKKRPDVTHFFVSAKKSPCVISFRGLCTVMPKNKRPYLVQDFQASGRQEFQGTSDRISKLGEKPCLRSVPCDVPTKSLTPGT